MWVFRRHWEALWDTAKQASGALFELEEARVEAAALREQVKRLERENTELRDWLVRQSHPGDVYTPWENTEPSRLYIPRGSDGTPIVSHVVSPAGPSDEVQTAKQWNTLYPIGTKVVAYPGGRDGTPLYTSTRSKAWTLSDGTPVVSVDHYSGGIGLAWVDPVQPPEDVAEELAESEAAVVPCPTCGQPHGSGGVCAGDVREAA